MRVGFVGPFPWFANHFPEGWESDPDIMCLDVDHGSYDNLLLLRNFRPDMTVFYRPELYPRRLVEAIPGYRVAFLSEPLPRLVNGVIEHTEETELRLQVYSSMQWPAFHRRIFYDESRSVTADLIGFPIDEFRPLPIDTSVFHPRNRANPEWDVVFVGKATPHRIQALDFLRISKLRFLWVAHGFTGARLADLFRSARAVLNVHADGKPQLEPRLTLGAACGPLVITESLSAPPSHLKGRIVELSSPWTDRALRDLLDDDTHPLAPRITTQDIAALSVRRMVDDIAERAGIRAPGPRGALVCGRNSP
jgi:hypothetical protein